MNTSRRPHRRSRHSVVPGPARRHRHRHVLRQSGRQPRAGERQSRLGERRAPARPAHHPQPDARSATTIGSIRTSCPGAVNADRRQVALSSYNNATTRRNIFNQTDLTYVASTGRLRHTLLGGAEIGRQLTDNFRNTGFFNNTATSLLVPYRQPDDHDAGDVPPERHRRRQPPADDVAADLRPGSDRTVPLRPGGRGAPLRSLRSAPTTTIATATRCSVPTISSRRAPALSSSRSRRSRSTAATASRICRAPAISSRR